MLSIGRDGLKRILFAFIVVASVMLIVGRLIGSPTAEAADKKTLVFGDSITAGAKDKIEGKGKNIEVDSVQGAAYSDRQGDLKKHVEDYNKKGNKVIIELGTNGELTKDNIDEIKKMYDKADVSFVNTKAGDNATDAAKKATEATNKNLKDAGVDTIDWAGSAGDYIKGDSMGVHPDDKGQDKLANLIADDIKGGDADTEKDEEEKAEKEKEKAHKQDTGGKDKNWNPSYASVVFDDTDDKNASKFYFDADAKGAGGTTVESIIREEADAKTGKEYAAFLNTLNRWNIYKTYSASADYLISKALILPKFFVGLILLICLIVSYAVTALVSGFAKIMGYLNIFAYMDGTQTLDNSNPLSSIFKPLLKIMNSVGDIGAAVLALLFGFTIMMFIYGVGKARARAQYLGKNTLKIVLGFFAIVGLPGLLALYLTTIGNFVEKSTTGENSINQLVTQIPSKYMVDTEGYISGSLKTGLQDAKKAKDAGKKGRELGNAFTHNRYVLQTEGIDFPKNRDEVIDKYPTNDFVKSINNVGAKGGNDASKNSIQLVFKWIGSTTITPEYIDSQYDVSKIDKKDSKDSDNKDDKKNKGLFSSIASAIHDVYEAGKSLFNGIVGHENKRMFQFKLSPEHDGVTVLNGKDILGGHLNQVEIKTASVAGNSLVSVFTQTGDMVLSTVAVTILFLVLILSVLSAAVKSISMLISNIIVASVGSIAGLIGVIMTVIMLAVSIFTAFFLVAFVGGAVDGVDSAINGVLNNENSFMNNMPGYLKQPASNIVHAFVMLVIVIFTLYARRTIVASIEGLFKRILNNLGLNTQNPDGSPNKHGQAAHNALSEMSASTANGAFAPERGAQAAMAAGRGILDSHQAAKEQGDLDDKRFANFGDYGKGALSSLAGNLSGQFQEGAANAERRNGGRQTVGSMFANGGAKGLNNLANKLDKNGDQTFDDQENAADDMDQARDDYNEAQGKVESLEDELADMKANGADEEDIEAKEQELADAKDDLNNKGQALDEATKKASESGVSLANQDEERKKMDEHIDRAKRNAREKQGELQDARNKYEEMENLGASESELADQQAEIERLEGEADSANQYVEDLEGARDKAESTTGIRDADGLVEAVNDKSASEGAIRQAKQNQELVESTGGLDSKSQKRAQNTAKAMDGKLDGLEQTAQGKADKAQAEIDGMNHINSNGGQAFTQGDVASHTDSIETARGALKATTDKIDSLKKDGFSANDIQAQENVAAAENLKADKLKASGAKPEEVQAQVETAQAATQKLNAMKNGDQKAKSQEIKRLGAQQAQIQSNIEGMQSIQSAMKSGRVNQSHVEAGQASLKQAQTQQAQAEQKLDAVQSRIQAGESVAQGERQQAEQQVEQAALQANSARRVLTGLKAQQATGGVVSDDRMKTAQSNLASAHKDLEAVKANRAQLKEVADGKVSSDGARAMQSAGTMLSHASQQRVNEKRQEVQTSQRALERAEAKASQGQMSSTELSRYRRTHEGLQQELQSANNDYKRSLREARGAGQIVDHVDKNIEKAKDNVTLAQTRSERAAEHSSATATRGGFGQRSSAQSGLKQRIARERDKYQARPGLYEQSLHDAASREKRSEAKRVRYHNRDREERNPYYNDAPESDKRRHDRTHPDYQPNSDRSAQRKEQRRESLRQNNSDYDR